MTAIWRKFSSNDVTWVTATCKVCHSGATFGRCGADLTFHHCGSAELIPLAVANGPSEVPARARSIYVEHAVEDRSNVEHAVSQ